MQPKVGTVPLGRLCDDALHSPSGRHYCGRVSSAGGCNGRDAGSQLGGMRPQLVAQCLDQRVQTAPGAASVVDAAAGICATIRTGGDPAAPSTAALGATAPPGVG